MFHKNVEGRVDNLIMKTKKMNFHLEDLWKVFKWLQYYQSKVNHLKSAFGVISIKFLEFIVHHHVSETRQSKIDVTKQISKLQNTRD